MVIREEKKNFYHMKIDCLKSNPREMWQTLNSLVSDRKRKNIEKLEIDGVVLSTSDEMADSLNEYFVRSINDIVIGIDRDTSNIVTDNQPQHRETLDCFAPIDYKQLYDVLSLLPNKGSPDDISLEFIKNTFEFIKCPLLNIINSSLEIGAIPTLLKVSTIVPIQKIKGAVKSEDFRPINMLPTIEKILEKVVYNQLMDFITEHNILVEYQSGFRKSHSCESALQYLLYEWKSLLEDNYSVGAVFLDLKRAFETIDRAILINKLKKYGIAAQALKWLIDYLENRKQVTKVNENISKEIGNNVGVPQGSIIGPLLFLIYINDIGLAIKHCKLHLFADDTLLYFSSKNINDLINTINLDLENLLGWFNVNVLKINIKKTKFMLVAGKKDQDLFVNSNLDIKIGNDNIERVRSYKYLGFILDSLLTFKDHFAYVIEKITKGINFMSRFTTTLSQWTKTTIYNTLVLPHLDYSSSVLYLGNKNEINRLQKLQNRAMRVILREKRETSIKSMLKRLDWLPVDKFLTHQNMTFIYKIKNGLTPNYLREKLIACASVHPYPTRNSSDFYVTAKNRKSAENILFHKGLLEFNSLPEHVKNAVSIGQFKFLLKKHLMGE